MLLLLTAAAASSCDRSNWSDTKVESSKRVGNQIFNALSACHEKTGNYPQQLSNLVPQFLPAIVPPAAGEGKWHYACHPDGQFFSMWFQEASEHPRCYARSPGNSGWSYDSGAFSD
jgi:hypothetical protein